MSNGTSLILDTRAPADEAPADQAAADQAAVVAQAVATLPFGLVITRLRDVKQVFGNQAAALHAREGDHLLLESENANSRRVVDVARQIASFDGEAYEVLTSLDVTEHRRIEDELAKRAFFDDLTGLPKRNIIEQTIDDMIADGCGPFALAFIDIDNFKYVNDYYGHPIGDELLVKIVRRIADGMRATDILARMGGDEFVLLVTPLVGAADEHCAAIEELSTRLKQPYFIGGFEIFSSASIGVSLYPVHGATYGVLRANADSAMYRVKGTTKGGVRIFDHQLSQAAAERMALEQRLRLAIRDKRLCCAFQAKVDFRIDRIVGLEVLLRWRDENGDIKPPGEFIELATDLGLMDDITMLVLKEVLEKIDLINEVFGEDVSLSINVAAKQACDFDFMQRLTDAIHATGFAERFILELTEEAYFTKSDFQARILPLLRARGISVSIDDFGVGYSSLSALAEITADELKVDQSFIRDIHRRPRSQILLKVIESLGVALRMRIVVEGVETEDELAYLRAATRISCAQGFYFARPLLLNGNATATGGAAARTVMGARQPPVNRARSGR